jgi:hypothetical protein
MKIPVSCSTNGFRVHIDYCFVKRFEIFTAVTILIMFFWVWEPCGLAGRSQRFGEFRIPFLPPYIIPLILAWSIQPWRWRQYASPKRWLLPASPHGAQTQKNIINYCFVLSEREHTLRTIRLCVATECLPQPVINQRSRCPTSLRKKQNVSVIPTSNRVG